MRRAAGRQGRDSTAQHAGNLANVGELEMSVWDPGRLLARVLSACVTMAATFATAQTATPLGGVSHDLARERARLLSDIRYELTLSVPAAKATFSTFKTTATRPAGSFVCLLNATSAAESFAPAKKIASLRFAPVAFRRRASRPTAESSSARSMC